MGFFKCTPNRKEIEHFCRILGELKKHIYWGIAMEGKIHVRRPDREFLLKIRSGQYEYDTLVERANEKVAQIEDLFQKSDFPEAPRRKWRRRMNY